ncbi:MAG: maltose/maltodextrin ABC transporter substrate-binding protein MalE [Caulobacter sp.]|nr:maltose/maltodextrin ABC transporter substrate-binding protein MalE [Vitreoscilla sp.]
MNSPRVPRRVAACAVAAALAVAPLLAQAAEPLKLLVWINPDKGYTGLQKVGARYAADTGVQVVVQHPDDAPSKFQAAAGAGKGPDIICWPHDRSGEWAKSGLIVPVKPRQALHDQIEDSAWNAFHYQGRTWGYPLSIEAIGLIWNKAMLKSAPTTWDQVVAIDKDLAMHGKKAILWDYNKSFFTWPLLAGSGGTIFAKKTDGSLDTDSVGVNAPGAVQAATMLQELIRTGVLPKGAGYSEMEGAFNRGEIAMMISGPWAWDNVRKSRIDFGVAPLPAVNGHEPKPFVGVLGCMIAAPSKSKDLARDFLENYLLTLDGLRTINADVPLGTPANKAYFAELKSDPHIAATMDNARRGEAVPNIPEVGKFWTAMDAALEAVTNLRQSPQDALDGAKARILVK